MWGDENLESLDSIEGFEVIKGTLFGRKNTGPLLSISIDGVSFSVTAHLALDNCECIQVLVNNQKKRILVKSATSREPEAINWTSGEKKAVWTPCPKLTSQIYRSWNLNPACRYRIPGKAVVYDRKAMILFDFNGDIIEEEIHKEEK